MFTFFFEDCAIRSRSTVYVPVINTQLEMLQNSLTFTILVPIWQTPVHHPYGLVINLELKFTVTQGLGVKNAQTIRSTKMLKSSHPIRFLWRYFQYLIVTFLEQITMSTYFSEKKRKSTFMLFDGLTFESKLGIFKRNTIDYFVLFTIY